MYKFQDERNKLFTEEGQRTFIAVRDQVKEMLEVSGAVKMGKAMKLPKVIGAEDSFTLMACVDRLVEMEELKEIPTNERGQNRVFVAT